MCPDCTVLYLIVLYCTVLYCTTVVSDLESLLPQRPLGGDAEEVSGGAHQRVTHTVRGEENSLHCTVCYLEGQKSLF